MAEDKKGKEKKEDKDKKEFKTPYWYLQLLARNKAREERIIWVLLPSVFIAIIFGALINYLLTDYEFRKDITVLIFAISIAGFAYIFNYYFITKKFKMDKYDYFAYYCGALSIDLGRLSYDNECNKEYYG